MSLTNTSFKVANAVVSASMVHNVVNQDSPVLFSILISTYVILPILHIDPVCFRKKVPG
jgi:hypothetical protein